MAHATVSVTVCINVLVLNWDNDCQLTPTMDECFSNCYCTASNYVYIKINLQTVVVTVPLWCKNGIILFINNHFNNFAIFEIKMKLS